LGIENEGTIPYHPRNMNNRDIKSTTEEYSEEDNG